MARTTTDRGRYYTSEIVEPGANFWSVTTLIDGGVPKPKLAPWYGKQASEAMLDELVPPLLATKKLLNEATSLKLGDDRASALDEHLAARHSTESAEGLAAFFEKREPRWDDRT